jgi:hypothetical protein
VQDPRLSQPSHGPRTAGEEASQPLLFTSSERPRAFVLGVFCSVVFCLACLFSKGKKVCNYSIHISHYISVNNKRFYNSKKRMYILVCCKTTHHDNEGH